MTTISITAVTACSNGTSSVTPTPPADVQSGIRNVHAVAASGTASQLTSCSVVATEDPGSTATVQQVSAIGPNDMYFASLAPTDGGAGLLQILKYSTGGGAIALPAPFQNLVFYAYLKALSDNDIWVAAYTNANPALQIAHWNGSTWTATALHGSYASTFVPRGISGLATNDVWLSGFIYVPGNTRAALAHWDGSSFSITIASPYYGAGGPVLELSPKTVLTTLEQSNNVYSMTWDGAHVTFHLLPAVPGENSAGATPQQIAATSASNVWIAGFGTGNIAGRIWRYNGQWQPYVYSSTGPAVFQGVTALDSMRTVVTSSEGSSMYGYSGTDRFHPITNTLGGTPTGPSELVPGTQTFWVPISTSSGLGIVQLMSCH